MKLTNKSEYALLALALLARNYGKGTLSAEVIADKQKIPKQFLQQILFTLKRAGYVESVKGKLGGYSLRKDPDEINIAEIVRCFEGPLAASPSASKNFYQPSPIELEPGVIGVFREIRDRTAEILESTSLASVSKKNFRKPKRSN